MTFLSDPAELCDLKGRVIFSMTCNKGQEFLKHKVGFSSPSLCVNDYYVSVRPFLVIILNFICYKHRHHS